MEAQLEVAVIELAGTDDFTETQGRRAVELIDRLKTLLKEGAVKDQPVVGGLRDLLSRIKAAMSTRDQVVHSTWLYTNSTKPGHVTGQRWRTRGSESRDWNPDQLERVREDLESLANELSSASWNAVMPPDKWI